ncbi:Putative methyltransferase C9orf114, partial [Araneus ventricosus]
LLNPLDLPHHLRVEDECKYREGIVLNKPVREGKGSFLYIGLKKTAIIDKILEPNVRVTVKLDENQSSKKHFKGKAVSPSAPTKMDNIYWGYNVRLAKGLNAVFSESPYKGGYDLTIGTSDTGKNVDTVKIPKFSDEKKWNLVEPDGNIKYWHDLQKGPRSFFSRHSGDGSVMVWAPFGFNGQVGLASLDGQQNSPKYRNTRISSYSFCRKHGMKLGISA